MARKRHQSKRSRSRFISPIDPSLHFVLFLVMALILIVVVTGIMQQVTSDTRAFIFCPHIGTKVADLAKDCPYGIAITRDANRCLVPVCKDKPDRIVTPSPRMYPLLK